MSMRVLTGSGFGAADRGVYQIMAGDMRLRAGGDGNELARGSWAGHRIPDLISLVRSANLVLRDPE